MGSAIDRYIDFQAALVQALFTAGQRCIAICAGPHWAAPVALHSADSKKLLFFKINVYADGKRWWH